MKQSKSCACLIGTTAINLEKSKRKTILEVEKIIKKLKNTKNPKKITILKNEKRELIESIKDITVHKNKVKKQFDDHVKKSGYKPPIFKSK
jgi:hypothetical protein